MRISGAERCWALLGYLPLLCYIPIKAYKRSIFVQFHARQGSVLFSLWLAGMVVLAILFISLEGSLATSAWFMGLVFTLILALNVWYLLMVVVALFKVLQGERYRMPVVADVALKMGL